MANGFDEDPPYEPPVTRWQRLENARLDAERALTELVLSEDKDEPDEWYGAREAFRDAINYLRVLQARETQR